MPVAAGLLCRLRDALFALRPGLLSSPPLQISRFLIASLCLVACAVRVHAVPCAPSAPRALLVGWLVPSRASQALKALDAARLALKSCTEDLTVLESKREEVSPPVVGGVAPCGSQDRDPSCVVLGAW